MPNCNWKFLTTALTVFSLLSLGVVAGEYNFNGKTYKLSKYESLPPKPINKNLSLYSILKGLYPDKLLLQEFQSPVKDQGSRGACAYFSTTALVESLIKKKMGKTVNMSEEYLIYYGKAVRGESSNGDGSSARLNLNALKDGFFLEKDMPYGPSWFEKGLPCENYKDEDPGTPVRCYAHDGPGDAIKDRHIRFENMNVINVNGTSLGIIEAMNRNKAPVVVGLPLHPEGWNGETGECVYNEEYRKKCEEDPNAQCGGHSILLIGYDLKEKKFYFKNSWGYSWGKDGYGTLPFDYIDQYNASSTVTADLTGSIKLPADYDQVSSPSIMNANFVVNQTGDIEVSLTGDFNNVLNRVLYASTFIAHKKDNNLPMDDQNAEVMEVPENLRKDYGFYVRGFDYVFKMGQSSINVDLLDPFKMLIPSVVITKDPNVSEYYLRISAYVHDDIEGWNKVFRTYSPIGL